MQLSKLMVPHVGADPGAPPDYRSHATPVDGSTQPSIATPLLALEATTLIHTPDGVRCVNTLTDGDWVLSRSGTSVPILRIEHIHFTAEQLHDTPEVAPIRFDAGALPAMSSGTAVLLAPDLPIIWNPEPTSSLGASYPARAFCNGGLIRRVIPADGVHYIRLHLEEPVQLCGGGIWVELSEAPVMEHNAAQLPSLAHPNDVCVFRPLLD